MEVALIFNEAVETWKRPLPEDEGYIDAIDRIERLILGHRPTSLGEAVAMIDLLISEYECGPRSDEMDRQALTAIRVWIVDEASRATGQQG